MMIPKLLVALGVCAGLVFLWPARQQSVLEPVSVEDVSTQGDEPLVEGRRAAWGIPLMGRGLSNFFKFSDQLYRGAQPEPAGYATLRDLGVKTILNLRQFHSGRDEAAAAGLNYESFSVNTLHLEDKEIEGFLSLVTNPAKTPLFVHCMHGSDRTGTLCAIYRIVVQGWTREEALTEMRQGDYGFHEMFGNLVDEINELDVEKWRLKYGPQ